VLLGIADSAWGAGGDGVTYRILAEREGRAPAVLVQGTLESDHRAADGGWREEDFSLGELGGEVVRFVLETSPGPAGDPTSDWVGWARLEISSPPGPVPVVLCDVGSGAQQPRELRRELPPGGNLTFQLRRPSRDLRADSIRLVLTPLADGPDPAMAEKKPGDAVPSG
jgi:hypothetical protein